MKVLSMGFSMLLLAFVTEAASPSITLTAPTTTQSFNEGDDFFTTVLNSRITFDKRRDILWEENYTESSIGVSNNIWTGTSANTGAYVYLHFHGVPGSAQVGKTGGNYPIVTSKYTGVSVFSAMAKQSDRSLKVLRWTHDYTKNPDLTGSDGCYQEVNDSVWTNAKIIPHGDNEWTFDIVDLSSKSTWTSSNVAGILYDQSSAAGANATEKYSKFRIYDPTSAPNLTISWSYSNIPDIIAKTVTPQVTIYIDTKNSGYAGAIVARVPLYNASSQTDLNNGTGSYTIPVAALPPGTYYFYTRITDNEGLVDGDQLNALSAYSEAITVTPKSLVTFQNPSYTSGADFASTVIGAPWNFTDSSCMTNFNDSESAKGYRNGNFTNGYFSATAFCATGNTESEAQLWMNTAVTTNSINPKKFKYLTVSMKLDPTNYGNISDKITRGWIARAIFTNQGLTIDGSVSNDILIYENDYTFSVDLSTIALESEETGVPNVGWTALSKVRYFRFDPCEVPIDTIFNMYSMKITANPEPDYTTNLFPVQFTVPDNGNGSVTVALYLDVDKSGYNGTLVSTGTYAPGSHTVNISTASLSKADYYVYAVNTDAKGNVSKYYADVPFTVATATTQGNKVARYRLYNPNSGQHHYTTSQSEYVTLGTWGWAQEGASSYILDSAGNIDGTDSNPYYRIYNSINGEHFWTINATEYNYLGSVGWTQENVDGNIFYRQVTNSLPLYRLYNPNSGLHHWTKDAYERSVLMSIGWSDEGIAGYVFSDAN